MRYAMPPERHAALFGTQHEDRGAGRARLCKVCQGWHERGKVPDNCRPERPPRANLAAPQIAPPFGEFRTGLIDGEVITTRHERAEHMKRNDLVDWDPGIGAKNEWIEDRAHMNAIAQDLLRMEQMDPLELQNPELQAERLDESGSLDDGTEIDTDGIEVAK